MENLWREGEARGLAGVDLLIYRSRLIGRDENLVQWGGGNTSIKQTETDFRGREIRVMRIKGSGSDLRSAGPAEFPGIRLDDVESLRERDTMSDEEIVRFLAHCMVDPGSGRPSIETLLHAFIPHPHIDHTHADAILVLTNTNDGKRHVRACFGDEAIWIPYRRPGFLLSQEVAAAVGKNPSARCAILEKHGLITWGAGARESYDATIEMNTRAEDYARRESGGGAVPGGRGRAPLAPEARARVAAAVAPLLRGLLSRADDGTVSRAVLRFDDTEEVLEFAGSEAGPRLCLAGPATPDHVLYTRPRPLFLHQGLPERLDDEAGIEALKEALTRGVEEYASWYDVYFRKNSDGSITSLGNRPRVILLPGIGMFTAWKDARHTGIVSDIYHHSIRVMRGAQAIGGFRSLSLRETFEVEYWPAELYKLRLAKPERELSRRVALITGAACGIGRAIARRLADEGCHVVVTDRDAAGARALADEIVAHHGIGRAHAVRVDVAIEAEVIAGFREAALTYGGVDIVVSNAGIAHSCPIEAMDLNDWQRSFDVNATGHFLIGREAVRIQRGQGIGGSLVFIASKNVLAPGRDFGAYSAAKAAETQLARILAIEAGGHGVRVNIVNPDAVFQETGLWSREVREERARAHGIDVDQLEDFYRRRNLLQTKVLPQDVAEAVLWLASDRSARTTGCILTTDGGVREAFPR